jgi:hypothetical protein
MSQYVPKSPPTLTFAQVTALPPEVCKTAPRPGSSKGLRQRVDHPHRRVQLRITAGSPELVSARFHQREPVLRRSLVAGEDRRAR